MTRTAKTLPDRLQTIISEELGIDEEVITPDADLVHDLGADSLDVVELVMRLEEDFGLEITDEDAERFVHVRDIRAYLDKHAAVKA